MENRAADMKSSDTLTDVRLCTPKRRKKEKRPLNKRPIDKLLVWCPQPCRSQPEKGSSHGSTAGICGQAKQNN